MNGFKYKDTTTCTMMALSSLSKSFIDEIAKHEQLDILVNVVGVFFPRGQLVPEYSGEVFRWIQHKYHNEGSSPWSDKTYDHVCEIMKKYYNITVDDVVGASVTGGGGEGEGGGAVSLPIFMGSMNKYKTEKEIMLWKQKYSGPYIVSAKLDGISALWVHGKGLFTRGNGVQGQNISYLLPYLNMGVGVGVGVGMGMGMGIENGPGKCVRGELIMKKSTFQQKYQTEYANARNLVCGVIHRNFDAENTDTTIYQDIDFVAYDIYYDEHKNATNYEDKFSWLSKQGYEVVAHACGLPSISVPIGDKWLQTWKGSEGIDYDIDGIIFTNQGIHIHPSSGNPGFAFAYKNNDLCVNKAVGVVKSVLWNISKDQYLKPKIQLVTPIQCDQSKVEFVTGFNAKYILENRIGAGTQLLIGLSGNVIPHIFDVLGDESGGSGTGSEVAEVDESKYFKEIPYSYQWSKNKVDLICDDKDNYESCIKKNVQFFKAFELKCSLQEKTLVNVYNSLGVYHLKDILSLSLEDWVKVSKMGEKKASGILTGLYDALHWENVKSSESCYDAFLKWSVGLQTFERGFAAKKIKLFVDYLLGCGVGEGGGGSGFDFDFCLCHDLQYLSKYKNSLLDLVEHQKPKQITVDTMRLFLVGLERFVSTVQELGTISSVFTIVDARTLMMGLRGASGSGSGGGSGKMKQYSFVFSGVRDKSVEAIMKSDGHTIEERVTKEVAMLIVKNDDVFTKPPSSKMKKATELNVPIYTIDEFNIWYKEYKELFL